MLNDLYNLKITKMFHFIKNNELKTSML
jgi:hypothetical protein